MGCQILRRHIWGYAVCLCPIKRMPGLNELKKNPFLIYNSGNRKLRLTSTLSSSFSYTDRANPFFFSFRFPTILGGCAIWFCTRTVWACLNLGCHWLCFVFMSHLTASVIWRLRYKELSKTT